MDAQIITHWVVVFEPWQNVIPGDLVDSISIHFFFRFVEDWPHFFLQEPTPLKTVT